MKNKLFVKTMTLLFFATLVTCFLLYRTGNLTSLLAASAHANKNDQPAVATDTLVPPRKDSLVSLRLSSSKVIVSTDVERARLATPHLDTAKLRGIKQGQQLEKKRYTMMSGSKSGRPFSPADSIDKKIDSFIRETYKKQKN